MRSPKKILALPHLSRSGRAATRTALAAVAVTALALGYIASANAATTDPNPSERELAHAALSQRAATQGMVLLENHDHALPIATSGNIALFGVGAVRTVKGGTGSGAVNNRYIISVAQGFDEAGYTLTTNESYWTALGSSGDNDPALTDTTVQPTAPTDTAIYVVARNSGEGRDRSSGEGDYLLDPVETANLTLLGQTYATVIVVLNTGGVMDTTFFRTINASATDPAGGQALDSLLLMSQPGQEAGHALVQVLDGTVSPSGKLVDTWASAYSYYPAAATFAANDGNTTREEYTEGIYVGYRYFDSFYKSLNVDDPASVVNYPFGYGLSYTTFRIDPFGVVANNNEVTVRAKVTNTGTVSGKQVVEVYVSASQTGLDKPYQELKGYAKTGSLAPGTSELVTIKFPTSELASYDIDRQGYVVEAGDYLIRLGDSSRSTKVVAKLTLSTTTLTEQLANELPDEAPATELTSDPADFYTYASEGDEIASALQISVNTKGMRTADNTSPYEQTVPIDASSPYYSADYGEIGTTTAYIDPDQTDWEGTGAVYEPKTGESVQYIQTDPDTTLYDVYRGEATMTEFVAGLSLTQLANIVEGADRGGTTNKAVGAAGYTTALYESLGVPGLTLPDGPAGLRITQTISGDPTTYQFATAWPIGTALAQTWDVDLQKEIGLAVGVEMAEFGANLWLAPGMNLHRDPLNGRNFEYYSEDPLITGMTAASETLGVQTTPGVGVTIKHFVANNQESSRTSGNSVVGERALRELYLKGFEIAVKSAQPMAIMSSYNRVNGPYTAESYDLLTDILRGEWGFKGLVMTDWGGVRAGALDVQYAGNDLIMPGRNPNEVISESKLIEPTIDLNGMPAYQRSWRSWGLQLGNLTLSGTGSATYSTTVDASTDLTAVPLSGTTSWGGGFTPVDPYGTVDGAYQAAQTLLESTAFDETTRAGITFADVTQADPADSASPVVSYTVTIRGDFSAPAMRLGDVQRNAARILNIVMQSAAFAELAQNQGVSDITAGSYTAQFDKLAEYVVTTHEAIDSSAVGPMAAQADG